MLKQYVIEPSSLTCIPRSDCGYSWRYWIINPDQAVTDPKMSPPSPLSNILRRGKPTTGPEHSQDGSTDGRDVVPEKRQGHGDMV